ncbi:MAG: tetratricopeptide repeat protein [Chloracidobacterium sp.]|nr:tetratricopeptide repeat protein [Chloracidobacterium sp.]
MQDPLISLKSGSRRAAVILIAGALIALLYFPVKWAFGHAVAVNAESAEVAAFGIGFAPDDARARFDHALLLEQTLLPGDQELAIQEFEAAVRLSPNNYVYWLYLGNALERAGDPARAEPCLRRALELAPNYARVQWALGNLLLRQGRVDEAFELVRRAVSQDGKYADPASVLAWQLFDKDIVRVNEILGDSPAVHASLAAILASEGRFDDAVAAWRRLPIQGDNSPFHEKGRAIFARLFDAGRFTAAIEVGKSVGAVEDDVRPGAVTNGGFESALSAADGRGFTWAIADGDDPRVGLNEGQKHSGKYSLLMSFSPGGRGFRPVVQRVGLDRTGIYVLEFYYRSELKGNSTPVFEILIPGDTVPAARAKLQPNEGWAGVRLPFTVPPGAEGVELRLSVEGCQPQDCSFTGNIWFDDFSMTFEQ